MTGRQLQFGSESEEKEQEQGKEEKASEQQEEVAWRGVAVQNPVRAGAATRGTGAHLRHI